MSLIRRFIFLLIVPGILPGALCAAPSDITEVTRGDIEQVVATTGVLKPSALVHVGAQVNGQIQKLYVKQGDQVKAGQLLAEIDPKLQQNELMNAEAMLNSARAQKSASEVTLKRYKKALDRERKLAHDGSGVQAALEEAEANYYSQLEQVKVNEAQVVQSQVQVETARTNLGYTRIEAPISGEVLGIVAQEGQTIVSSQSAPTILVLGNMDVMDVQTRISEADILNVSPGQKLWCFVQAEPGTRYNGVLSTIQSAPDSVLKDPNTSNTADGDGQAVYYNGNFTLNNPGHRLKTSMTVRVFILNAQAKGVLRIPLEALGEKTGEARYRVRVVHGNSTTEKTITTGIRDHQFIEVTSGLRKGEKILLAPLAGKTS
ncbi:efflux RND transporter periplasmic adaptor subunit [Enterobacillus tribolii]|uniref:Macrolide-specific efflux system membrane fusion protein n=1 Tax=Enterobacillus tribolii TaxID=1487935 RepID=A0A370R4I4_9GAMM|nr:efflux RND transporter periplasmic adaptor subunit [Enterobacillus tribolii]MBW7983275.1 efflux RND transporter periplasmic adaptor subunit [Enterobacillus tribolii]RDK97333.1 macrolide-specific efflux system membrane fusion protein [Enterobacillus tribolii]